MADHRLDREALQGAAARLGLALVGEALQHLGQDEITDQDDAQPHQLLVTASLYDTAGEGLRGRRLGPHRIRGFTRPVEVVDLSQGDHRQDQQGRHDSEQRPHRIPPYRRANELGNPRSRASSYARVQRVVV